MSEEVVEVISRLKNGKATGKDGLTAEMIKYSERTGYEQLTKIMNLAWKTKTIPNGWKVATILPIYKTGDRKVCDNYRGITLLNTSEKIYEGVLSNRLRNQVERKLDDCQSGFRPARST